MLLKETSLFVVSWQAERDGQGRGSVQGSHVVGEEGSEYVGRSDTGLNGGRDVGIGGIYSSFSSPWVMT